MFVAKETFKNIFKNDSKPAKKVSQEEQKVIEVIGTLNVTEEKANQIPEKSIEDTGETLAAAVTEIPEAKSFTRVELIMNDEETGESKVLVSTDYATDPAVVPPRENVPVVTLPEDGRVTDASLEEKILAAAARKGITLETSSSPMVAALSAASAANVKKGNNTPRNVGRNVVRINQ